MANHGEIGALLRSDCRAELERERRELEARKIELAREEGVRARPGRATAAKVHALGSGTAERAEGADRQANLPREERRGRLDALAALGQRSREHRLAHGENHDIARPRAEVDDHHGPVPSAVGPRALRDEGHHVGERQSAEPDALGFKPRRLARRGDPLSDVLDADDADQQGDPHDILFVDLRRTRQEAIIEDGFAHLERDLRLELEGQHLGDLLDRACGKRHGPDGGPRSVDGDGDRVRGACRGQRRLHGGAEGRADLDPVLIPHHVYLDERVERRPAIERAHGGHLDRVCSDIDSQPGRHPSTRCGKK